MEVTLKESKRLKRTKYLLGMDIKRKKQERERKGPLLERTLKESERLKRTNPWKGH